MSSSEPANLSREFIGRNRTATFTFACSIEELVVVVLVMVIGVVVVVVVIEKVESTASFSFSLRRTIYEKLWRSLALSLLQYQGLKAKGFTLMFRAGIVNSLKRTLFTSTKSLKMVLINQLIN